MYNYYRRPFWKIKLFYVLFLILITGIIFVYWSITRPFGNNKPKEAETVDSLPFEKYSLRLSNLQGKVFYKKTGEDLWVQATDQSALSAGDQIQTGPDGQVTLEIKDLAVIRLNTGSEIKYDGIENNVCRLWQKEGNVYYRFLPNNEIIFQVNYDQLQLTGQDAVFNLAYDPTKAIVLLYTFDKKIKAQLVKDQEITALNYIDEGYLTTLNFSLPPTDFFKNSTPFDRQTILDNPWFNSNNNLDSQSGLSQVINFGSDIPDNIILTGYIKESKVYLEWKIEGGPSKYGYKIFMDKKEDPSSTQNLAQHYLNNALAKNDVWTNLTADQEYYFRVGVYGGQETEDNILKYSNNFKIKISTAEEASLSLTGFINKQGQIEVNWQLNNLETLEGYKLLLSDKANPTEKTATKFYLIAEPTLSNYVIKDSLENNTYHLRLCRLSEQYCVLYSNDYILSIDDQTKPNIKLQATLNNYDVNLQWTPHNINSNLGYRLFKSENSLPVFENSEVKTFDSLNTLEYSWINLTKDKTYYFRVCEYIGDNQCGVYSNIVPLKIASQIDSSKELNLTANYAWGKIHLTWTSKNLDDISGYYTLLSETPNVMYPVRNGNFHMIDAKTKYDSWTVDPNKTYYLKVCAFKNDFCLAYSNELMVKTN